MWFFKIASLQLVDSAFLPRCFCFSHLIGSFLLYKGYLRFFWHRQAILVDLLTNFLENSSLHWHRWLRINAQSRRLPSNQHTPCQNISELFVVGLPLQASVSTVYSSRSFLGRTWTRARPDSGSRVRSSLRSSKQLGRVESDFYNMRFSSFRLPPAKRVGCDSFRWIQHIWYCHLKWLGTFIHPI